MGKGGGALDGGTSLVTQVPFFPVCVERITQSVVKSHVETSQYSTEELKRMAWTLYSPEETHSYQMKVRTRCLFEK